MNVEGGIEGSIRKRSGPCRHAIPVSHAHRQSFRLRILDEALQWIETSYEINRRLGFDLGSNY